MELSQLLQDFKAAYDEMEAGDIANLFADVVEFQGTAETEYRTILRADVAKYFADIAENRSSQELELISLENAEDIISVNAVFHSAATDKKPNVDKHVRFTMRLNDEKIEKFRSNSRDEGDLSHSFDFDG